MKKVLSRLLPKDKMARGVGVLVGGTTGAQILSIIAAPLLTRLYMPSDFGVLAIYSALLAVYVVIASLRYELAILLPESEGEAVSLVLLSFLVTVASTIICAVAVHYLGDWMASIFGEPALASHLWLLPAGVFLGGGYKTLKYYALRKKRYADIALTGFSQKISIILIQCVGYKLGGLALVLGQAFGQGVGNLRLGKLLWGELKSHGTSIQLIFTSAIRYKRFPLLDTWGALFNVLGTQSVPLMLAVVFGPLTAGLYALAHRVLILPMGFIGAAIGNVFFSSASDALRDGSLNVLFQKNFDKLAAIAMPPALYLFVCGEDAFRFIFGNEWAMAGKYASVMSIWLLAQFITAPLTSLFTVLEKQAHASFFQGLLLLVRLGSLSLGFFTLDVLAVITIFAVASTIGYLIMLLWMASNAGAALTRMGLATLKYWLITMATLVPVFLCNYYDAAGLLLMAGYASSSLLVILFYIRLLKLAY